MLKRTKEEIACAILVIGGIAVCIGGFFLAPLLVLGGAMIAGGLTVLSNMLQENDRLNIINNNYGAIPAPAMDMSRAPEVIKATPKEKLAALFAFKNRKYALHQEEIKMEEMAEPVYVELPDDIKAELVKMNNIINSFDLSLMKKIAQQYKDTAEDCDFTNQV